MMKKAWGILCMKNEVEDMKKALEKRDMDIFEVRPLTLEEKFNYTRKDPLLFMNEPHIVMFHATTLQYKWFLFRNELSKVF